MRSSKSESYREFPMRAAARGEDIHLGQLHAFTGSVIAAVILGVSLAGLSPAVIILGFHVQVLELLEAVALFWLACALPKISKSGPVTGMVGLCLFNMIPLLFGLYTYGANAALRDFAGVYYMMMVVFGYALGRFAVITSTTILQGFSLAGLIFIAGYTFRWMGDTIDYEMLEYNFRAPAIASFNAAVLCATGLSRLRGWRWASVLLGGVFYAIFLLQLRTRAAYLALIIGGLILLAQCARLAASRVQYRARIIGSLATLATIASFVMIAYSGSVSSFFANAVDRTDILFSGAYETDVTVAFRLDAWRMAWQEFEASPLIGVGFGKYMLLDPLLRSEPELYPSHMMHNGVLQILYSGGLMGCAGAFYFWWRVHRTLQKNATIRVVIPLLAVSVSYLAYVAFGAILFKSVEALPLWLIVGLAIGEAERFRVINRQTEALKLVHAGTTK